MGGAAHAPTVWGEQARGRLITTRSISRSVGPLRSPTAAARPGPGSFARSVVSDARVSFALATGLTLSASLFLPLPPIARSCRG